MPELVRRHVDAEILLDRPDHLIGERVLAFRRSVPGDKEVAIRIGVEARKNVPALPAKPTGNEFWDLGDEVVFS
jgi:hypothetical protein